jgi:hypothetical protein
VETKTLQNNTFQTVSLFGTFVGRNEGSGGTMPVFRLQFNAVNSNLGSIAIPSLMNVKIINTQTAETVEYSGEVRAGDTLLFLSEGALLNGQKQATIGKVSLSTGDSTFQIQADWGPAAEYHPIARFGSGVPIENAVFTNGETFATVELSYQKLTYGAFQAVVPWDIAGFSSTIEVTQATLDKLKILNVLEADLTGFQTLIGTYETLKSFYAAFNAVQPLPADDRYRNYLKELLLQEANLKDKYAAFHPNPRHQIAAIVERVKAAGVYSEVVFEKRFAEHQQLEDRLKFILTQIKKEDHEIKEKELSVNIAVQLIEKLESADSFKFAAVLAETLELEDALTLAPVLVETLELKDSLTLAPVLVETLELKDSLTLTGNDEKRFNEQQPLDDKLNITQTKTQMESQDMEDTRFRVEHNGKLVEKLELADTLRLSAVLDFTYFDSLNGFA